MKNLALAATLAAASLTAVSAQATGLATCDSGPQASWQSQEKLTQDLTARGWKVNRIKVDGNCYEVYGVNEKGQRVEAYFHPKTLEFIPTERSAKK